MERLPRKLLFGAMALFGLAAVLAPCVVSASSETVRTVRGEVVAVNTQDTPQVIVVKAMTAKKQEMIVGATVDQGVKITRGSQRVSLGDIKAGEVVELQYVKHQDGLAARSIHVR